MENALLIHFELVAPQDDWRVQGTGGKRWWVILFFYDNGRTTNLSFAGKTKRSWNNFTKFLFTIGRFEAEGEFTSEMRQ